MPHDAVPLEPLMQNRIIALRAQRVMLKAALAQLYGIETRALVQAVKRNLARLPGDFMFQLSAAEFANLRSQTVISSAAHGGRRTAPYAFSEQGVTMLSPVLSSPRAIAVNIEIMGACHRIIAVMLGRNPNQDRTGRAERFLRCNSTADLFSSL